jgi:hypothetical protein
LRHQFRYAPFLAQGGNAHTLDRFGIAGGADLGEQRGFKGGEVDGFSHDV